MSWRKYWHTKEFVKTESGRFCVYHGGSRDSKVSLVLLHGAGYSGLTWSTLGENLASLADTRLLALDLRGHGETEVSEEEIDMSGQRMARDVVEVLLGLYTDSDLGVVIMGHSMGGALAAMVAEMMEGLEKGPRLLGLVVEDVVEGTAMEALAGMHTVLQNRPKQFQGLEQAVEWAVRSGQVRNVESARVSVPGQVITETGELVARLIEDSREEEVEESSQGPSKREKLDNSDSIKEEEEEEGTESIDDFKMPKAPEVKPAVDRTPPETFTGSQVLRWRIDLTRTEPHWSGWFQGLSQRFLSAPGARLLLLAGVDRLDKDLTVGQMQGKFQMQVLPQVGHTVHEDSPDRVAEVLAGFLVRNKFCQPLEDFSPTLPGCTFHI